MCSIINVAVSLLWVLCTMNRKMEAAAGDNFAPTEQDIEYLLEERSQCRSRRDYQRSDEIKSILNSKGIEIIDQPQKSGGKSTWKKIVDRRNETFTCDVNGEHFDSLMDFCRNLFRLKSTKVIGDKQISDIVNSFLRISLEDDDDGSERTKILLSPTREVQGRKFADVAFELSMSGVTDPELYRKLEVGSERELLRWGHRESCRPADVCRVAEKLACAGVASQAVYAVAARVLRGRGAPETMCAGLASGSFGLLSDRPLLWLWRFASKQHKAGRQMGTLATASSSGAASRQRLGVPGDDDDVDDNDGDSDDLYSDVDVDVETEITQDLEKVHLQGDDMREGAEVTRGGDEEFTRQNLGPVDFGDLFADPSLPLVVDLGCGYGVSLLGLARDNRQAPDEEEKEEEVHTAEGGDCEKGNAMRRRRRVTRRCNFLGCDLSVRAVTYAQGIAKRWGLDPHCAFLVCDAAAGLLALREGYPGPVVWINVHFPTPYALGLVLAPTTSGTEEEQREMPGTAAMSRSSNPPSLASGAVLSPSGPITEENSPSTTLSSSTTTVSSTRATSVGGGAGGGHGNTQLPMRLSDFMVSPDVVDMAQSLLTQPPPPHRHHHHPTTHGEEVVAKEEDGQRCDGALKGEGMWPRCLFVQTNVEDVAVTVTRIMAEVNNGPKSKSPDASPRALRLPTSALEASSAWTRLMDAVDAAPAQAGVLVSTEGGAVRADNTDSEVTVSMQRTAGALSTQHLLHSSEEGSQIEGRTEEDAKNDNENGKPEKKKNTTKEEEEGEEEHWARLTEDGAQRLTQRARRWAEAGGRRAVGEGFLSRSPLPPCGQTETEVACEFHGTPVHRLLFLAPGPGPAPPSMGSHTGVATVMRFPRALR